jgi:hypothetical protein
VAHFGFHDLHSFKDYVSFVRLCAPIDFPIEDYLGPDDQWTLERAFEGLRHGLVIASAEKGVLPVFATCSILVNEAYQAYRNGNVRDGYRKLQEMETMLRKLPVQ